MLQTDYATGSKIAPTPDDAGDMCSYRAEYAFLAADLTLGAILELGPLPAGCDLVDVILDSDDLDAGATPAVTLDVGVLSGTAGDNNAARTMDAVIFSASTVAQAGGVVRPTLASAFRIARSDTDTGIGLKVKAAPATAAAGTVGVTLIYRG